MSRLLDLQHEPAEYEGEGDRDRENATRHEAAHVIAGDDGHQPAIGETYISTGSLYLCSVAFLPLGREATDPFWSSTAQPWTSVKAWSGQAFQIDHAI